MLDYYFSGTFRPISPDGLVRLVHRVEADPDGFVAALQEGYEAPTGSPPDYSEARAYFNTAAFVLGIARTPTADSLRLELFRMVARDFRRFKAAEAAARPEGAYQAAVQTYPVEAALQSLVETMRRAGDTRAVWEVIALTPVSGSSLRQKIGEYAESVGAPNPLSAGRPPADEDADVLPILECVEVYPEGVVTAYFGYDNQGGASVTIPYGAANRLSPAAFDRTQPEVFILPEAMAHRPGRTPPFPAHVFAVTFPQADRVEWVLSGETVAASADSPRCPQP